MCALIRPSARLGCLLGLAALLTACAGPAPTLTPTVLAPTNTPPVTVTVALPMASPTATTAATPLPESSPTPRPTATLAVTETPSATDTAAPTPTAAEPLTDRAQFVKDVTIPDGAPQLVGSAFVKTWQLKNVGTATWTTGYALVFVKGEPMTSTKTIPLPVSVGPGETMDLSIALQAPATTGRYQSYWQLQNPAGGLYGIGPNANEPIYLDILAVTEKTLTGPAVEVNSVALSVAQNTVTAACPYDLSLNGALGIKSGGVGRVVYDLEATFTDQNFSYTAPPRVESFFQGTEVSPYPLVYTLTFKGPVHATFQLHVLAPAELRSAPATFSLTCAP